jgi:hypothetical protein
MFDFLAGRVISFQFGRDVCRLSPSHPLDDKTTHDTRRNPMEGSEHVTHAPVIAPRL